MERTIWVCPNCGSTDIGVDRTQLMSWVGLERAYRCNKCGYAGIIPEVAEDDVDEYQRAIWERGRITHNEEQDGPTRGRIILGTLCLLGGVLPAVYAPWGAGKLAGLLSLVIGGAILFEYVSRRYPL